MRISDWSSDVCSSDLVAVARKADRRRERASHPCCQRAVQRIATIRIAKRQRRQRDINPAGTAADRHGVGGFAGARAAVRRRQRLLRVERARQPRSEEHTSELQSLMRNSYAVFCLKKKNNHMKSQPDNIY